VKVIQSKFFRSGHDHEVLERSGNVLLVRRQHRTVSVPHWEVVRIRVSPAKLVFGVPRPECEVYPSSEDWGKRGWTYTTLEDAQAKFAELTQKPTNP